MLYGDFVVEWGISKNKLSVEQREVIAAHYRLAEQVYGPKRACAVMRNFGIKYSRVHPNATEVRGAFIAVRDPGQWWSVLGTWYAEDRAGRYPPPTDAAESETASE